MTESSFYVYALVDPRNNLPFYIGKGKSSKGEYKRPDNHLFSSRQSNPLKKNVIRKILDLGLEISQIILADYLNEEDSFVLERFFIRIYGRRSDNSGILTNLTDGGEGPSGLKWTQEQRIQCGLVRKKVYKENPNLKESARQKILARIAEKGSYRHTQEDKIKISIAQKNRFKNQQGTMKGKKHSQETKQKLSEIRKAQGCTLPPEERHKFGSKGSKNHFAVKKLFISPRGEEFEVCGNFYEFIKQMNLCSNTFKQFLNKGIIPPTGNSKPTKRNNTTGWQVKNI